MKIGQRYKGRTGNIFTLFREFDANTECFRRQDGQLHFGREFIEFRDGKVVLDLEKAWEPETANAPNE